MSKAKKLYIGTSTKMFKNIAQTMDYFLDVCENTKDISREDFELFAMPSFTALHEVHKNIQSEQIKLGAQNMCWEDEGPFTGEISPLMLKEVGVQVVLIGHSERRHIMLETDEMVNKKTLCALRNGFIPMVSIGETREQKNYGLSDEVLRTQLKIALNGVSADQAKNIWVVYEPVWAIGDGGEPATKEYAEEKHCVIRKTLEELFGEDAAAQVTLIYGGSVNAETAPRLIMCRNVDGLFIGRSAWKSGESFAAIIRDVLSVWRNKE